MKNSQFTPITDIGIVNKTGQTADIIRTVIIPVWHSWNQRSTSLEWSDMFVPDRKRRYVWFAGSQAPFTDVSFWKRGQNLPTSSDWQTVLSSHKRENRLWTPVLLLITVYTTIPVFKGKKHSDPMKDCFKIGSIDVDLLRKSVRPWWVHFDDCSQHTNACFPLPYNYW